jgi:hypothetical protein
MHVTFLSITIVHKFNCQKLSGTGGLQTDALMHCPSRDKNDPFHADLFRLSTGAAKCVGDCSPDGGAVADFYS